MVGTASLDIATRTWVDNPVSITTWSLSRVRGFFTSRLALAENPDMIDITTP
jgi:hypothetical protein